MNYEKSIKDYRKMDLKDLALSITLVSKVLRDRVLETRVNTYPVKKEIIESIENLLNALKKIEEVDHQPL